MDKELRAKLDEARDRAGSEGAKAVIDVVASLDTRLERMDQMYAKVVSRADFDKRTAALAAARKHVKEMLGEQNARGYSRHSVTAETTLGMELRVAAYLMGEA